MPRKRIDYPIGSISSGTMRPEDLIPLFTSELEYRLKHGPTVSRATRKAHTALVREINARILDEREFEDIDLGIEGMADYDLESLFDALDAYAAPKFYFGAHPGNGSDYGYWLSETWDEDFVPVIDLQNEGWPGYSAGIKVSDLADVPAWFRGEVAVISDHGNVTLYVKTARTLREVWSIV